MNLILWCGDSPLLISYKDLLRAQTLKKREQVAKRIDTALGICQKVMEPHADLTKRIIDIKSRIRARQKGIPLTETLEPVGVDNLLSDGEAFLLKKAYRAAASLCHPDKGGNKDDFQAINAAYRSKDIGSLNEYVLSFQGTLNEQIRYWQTEVQKPDIEWGVFRASNENRIAQLYMQGQHAEADTLAKTLLTLVLSQAIAQDFYI